MTGSDLVPLELRDEVRRGGRRLFVWWVNATIVLVGVMVLGVRMGDIAADFHRSVPTPSFPSLSWTRTTETVHLPPTEPGGPTTERTLVFPHRVDAPRPAVRPQATPSAAAPRYVPLRLFLAVLLVAAWLSMIVLFRRSPSRTRPFVVRWLRADWLLCGMMLLALALQLSAAGFVATGSRWCADFAVQFRGTLLVAMVMLFVLRLFFRPADAVAPHESADEAAPPDGEAWEEPRHAG